MISIIIPTYNRAHTILRALGSIFLQSVSDWELIIVDDGSEDDSIKQVEHFVQVHNMESKTNLLRLAKNHGVSYARNRGVEMAKGDWLAFLDSDDEWLPHKLALQMQWIEGRKELVAIHGEEVWIRNGVRVNQMKKHQKFGGRIFSKCLPLCVISPSAVMIKKSVWNELGGMDETFPVCEDYDLWLKLTSLYEIGFIEEPIIVKHGGHDCQLSHKFKAMDYYRVKAIDRIIELRARELTMEQKDLAREILIKKSTILLSGFKKHNNMTHFNEVQKILQKYVS